MIRILFLAGALGLSANAQPPIAELPAARQALDDAGFAGTIVLYDPQRNTWQAGHAEHADKRVLPASTFKILNSLIALETGIVTGAESVLPWDGVARKRSEWNRNLDLRTAFQVSAVPHYQALARRIGADRMQRFVDAVGYGNRDISGGIDQFWLAGGLRISAREQVEFLARLYRGDLPFSAAAMAAVKDIMAGERTSGPVIRAKTGWAVPPGQDQAGWWVGWVERPSGVTIFATRLETGGALDDAFLPARISVTRRALEALGVL
ncbi:MAG: class D beta-lactamase [Bryobacterales bacterium]|nr:class D beta-lactamase [Bryobacterales bacterium]